jgi:NAD(P)-dependent dehydrogenase (short-subunit alcohol dehydrogenase family)
MGLLDTKVAVITGAGRGIGRAEALAFAAEGALVVVNDLGAERDGTGSDPAVADVVVDEIRRAGGTAVASYESVATAEGARAIVDTALRELGGLDIFVNGAGLLRDRTLLKMDPETFEAVLAVHVRGTWSCMQAAARAMVDQGRGGRILNTTSLAGLIGNFGQANYSAANAAIYGLTRAGALELRKHAITVNAIAPVARTRMTADLPMFQGVGEGSLGPHHVAPLAVFLASDLSRDLTGEVLGVAGGRLSRFKMIETAGAFKADGAWTAEEIHERWSEITRGS